MSYSIAIDKDFYISRRQIFNEFNHCLHTMQTGATMFLEERGEQMWTDSPIAFVMPF